MAIIATWSPATTASNIPTDSVPRLEMPIVLDEAYIPNNIKEPTIAIT